MSENGCKFVFQSMAPDIEGKWSYDQMCRA